MCVCEVSIVERTKAVTINTASRRGRLKRAQIYTTHLSGFGAFGFVFVLSGGRRALERGGEVEKKKKRKREKERKRNQKGVGCV